MVNLQPVNPKALGQALGYSHGMRAGPLLFVSGQLGADPLPDGRHRVVSADFAQQFEKALQNVLAIVREAGGDASAVAEMTVYVKEMDAYRRARPALGPVWKRTMGKSYPAMTLVEVGDLFEAGALLEIRAVAHLR